MLSKIGKLFSPSKKKEIEIEDELDDEHLQELYNEYLGGTHFDNYTICVLGRPGVGKSSLCMTYIFGAGDLDQYEYDDTIHNYEKKISVDGCTIELKILDPGGSRFVFSFEKS